MKFKTKFDLMKFNIFKFHEITFFELLIQFHFKFHKNILYSATEDNNIEVIKLLLAHKNIDVNIQSILFSLFQIAFQK